MAGFEIDGEMYEVPRLDSLNLNEEQILYDVAGIVQMDFVPSHPNWDDEAKRTRFQQMEEKLRNPAFKRALVHIAYVRKHPEAAWDEINVKIGTVSAVDSEIALLGRDADDPRTSSPNEPESGETSSEPLRPSSSTNGTGSESASQDESPAVTGATR